jgi:DNA-binding transcriptional regulator LsrR (DeoR family)
MDGWWNEIERDVHRWLDQHGALTPRQLAQHLGMSESAAGSLLSVLASEGKVRISLVEPTEADDRRQMNFLGEAVA